MYVPRFLGMSHDSAQRGLQGFMMEPLSSCLAELS